MQTAFNLARSSTRLVNLLGVLTCANFTAAQQDRTPHAPSAPTSDPLATFAWSDFDQDGLLDAAAVQSDGSLSLLKNLGDGSFADVTTSVGVDVQNVSFVLFEDGNGDGLPDLFLASKLPGGSQLYLNQAGIFQGATAGSGLEALAGVQEAQWLDYDADGELDLHVVGPGVNTLFHALGTARFEPIELPVAQPGQGSAFTAAALGLLAEEGAPRDLATLAGLDFDPDIGRGRTVAAGSGSRTPVGRPAGTGSGTQSMGTIVPGWPQCARLITDDATGNCIAASSTPTLGQLYPITSELYVDAVSGHVGLGTTTPSQSLQIGEFTTSQDALIEVRSGLGNGLLRQGLRMRSEGQGVGFDVQHDDSLGGLHVVNYDILAGAFGDSALFVNRQTGNVALGSTDAEHPLTVDAVNNGIVQRGYGIQVGTYAGLGAGWYGTYTNHPLSFFVANGLQAMTIDTNEFVGIGTTTPTVPLDVVTDDAGVASVVGIQNANPLGFSGLEIRDAQGSPKLSLRHSNDDAETFIECQNDFLRFSVNGVSALSLASSSCVINGSTNIGGDLFVGGGGDHRIFGQVGINTVFPTTSLHVSDVGSAILRLEADIDNSGGSDHAGIQFSQDNGLETAYIGFNDGDDELKIQSVTDDIDFDTGGSNRMRVTFGGNVGIGTTAPAQLLSVNGSAGKPGGGSWSNFSDRRLKKNIEDLDGALETLLELRGVTFEYKDPDAINELAGERIGFIAQEVESVVPDWVEDAGEYKMLTIRGFEALTVEALRELQGEILAKDAEMNVLREEFEREVAAKDAEIDELRAELQNLGSVAERVGAIEGALNELLTTR